MKKRILIVEDENLIQLSLVTALQSDSIELIPVASGEKALQKIASNPLFDLCIIDLSLPDINGMELIRSIKDNHPISNFIVMTGKYRDKQEMMEDSDEIADISSFGFISKPFDLDDAQEIIFEALAKDI